MLGFACTQAQSMSVYVYNTNVIWQSPLPSSHRPLHVMSHCRDVQSAAMRGGISVQ